MPERPLDIALFGATGFTGRLVAEYLAAHAPRTLRWALAGRNQKKLEGVRAELGKDHPHIAALPVRIADATDAASLEALVKDTRVVCTTVGPYMQYGRELIAACAEHGTHYCDLAGESPFVRDAIDRCHAQAERTGAKIVCCCGFDSIPSDLGTYLLHRHAAAPLAWVKMFVVSMRGKLSGGTMATLFGIVEAAKRDASLRRLVGNPYALDPNPDIRGPDRGNQKGARYDSDLRAWTGPFLMAGINTRVVRRSNALFNRAYGPSFRYSEVMALGRGAKGWVRASALGAGLGAFVGAVAIAPGLVKRALSAPGEGPSKAERDAGSFVVKFIAETEGGGAQRRLTARIEGKSNPGYGETAENARRVGAVPRIRRPPQPAAWRCTHPGNGHGDEARRSPSRRRDDPRRGRQVTAWRPATRPSNWDPRCTTRPGLSRARPLCRWARAPSVRGRTGKPPA